jgi:hypothetical protein
MLANSPGKGQAMDYEVVISRKRPLIGGRRNRSAFNRDNLLVWEALTTSGPKIAEEHAIGSLSLYSANPPQRIRDAIAAGELHILVRPLADRGELPEEFAETDYQVCTDHRGWPIFFGEADPEGLRIDMRSRGPDPAHWRYGELVAMGRANASRPVCPSPGWN